MGEEGINFGESFQVVFILQFEMRKKSKIIHDTFLWKNINMLGFLTFEKAAKNKMTMLKISFLELYNLKLRIVFKS